MSLLEVNGLTVRYGDNTAVDALSFAIGAGESVGLVGESGSGKSQTALAILGLLPESASIHGSITFEGKEILGAREAVLDEFRARGVAIVFQDPAQALNPFMRVGQQLRRVVMRHAVADAKAAKARILEMLKRVGRAAGPGAPVSCVSASTFRRYAPTGHDCPGPDSRAETPGR